MAYLRAPAQAAVPLGPPGMDPPAILAQTCLVSPGLFRKQLLELKI